MKQTTDSYTPPKIWTWLDSEGKDHGGKFSNTNRPTAGARHEQRLPRGDNPLQLYSLNTPNGIKINIMLEELSELGIADVGYDAFKVNIMNGDQFGSDFVSLNPNSKIPTLIDTSNENDVVIFESGAILMYLAEKYNQFFPSEFGQQRAEVMTWLMWQMGSAPYLGGGFGHFYAYAPKPMQYPINRFSMETKRQLDVLDKHLAKNEFVSSFGYSIADMAIWAWYGQLVQGKLYNAREFLQVESYLNVKRWTQTIANRPAVVRAIDVELQAI